MNKNQYQIENAQSIETVSSQCQDFELRGPKVRPVRTSAAFPQWDLQAIAGAKFNIRVW